MPTHNHGATTANGGHSHGRGSMNITGGFDVWYSTLLNHTGAFAGSAPTKNGGSDGNNTQTTYYDHTDFDASRSWAGITSTVDNHQHTTQDAGSGESHNNMQPYLAVAIWKRTA